MDYTVARLNRLETEMRIVKMHLADSNEHMIPTGMSRTREFCRLEQRLYDMEEEFAVLRMEVLHNKYMRDAPKARSGLSSQFGCSVDAGVDQTHYESQRANQTSISPAAPCSLVGSTDVVAGTCPPQDAENLIEFGADGENLSTQVTGHGSSRASTMATTITDASPRERHSSECFKHNVENRWANQVLSTPQTVASRQQGPCPFFDVNAPNEVHEPSSPVQQSPKLVMEYPALLPAADKWTWRPSRMPPKLTTLDDYIFDSRFNDGEHNRLAGSACFVEDMTDEEKQKHWKMLEEEDGKHTALEWETYYHLAVKPAYDRKKATEATQAWHQKEADSTEQEKTFMTKTWFKRFEDANLAGNRASPDNFEEGNIILNAASDVDYVGDTVVKFNPDDVKYPTLFRRLGEDSERSLHTILISNVPTDMTLESVLKHVQGAELGYVSYADTAGMKTKPPLTTNSVLVTFLMPYCATTYVHFRRVYPIYVSEHEGGRSGKKLKVTLVKTATF